MLKSLDIDICGSCNFACSYCYFSKSSRKDITYDISKLPSVKKIFFMGGEPLMNFDRIKRIKKPSWSITSNLSLLDDEIHDYIKANHGSIQASIDGCKEAHDMNRKFIDGSPTFDTVISRYLKYKRIIKSIRMTVNAETVGLLFDSIQYLHSLGAHKIAPVLVKESTMDWSLYEQQIKKLAEYNLRHPELHLKIFNDCTRTIISGHPCGAGFSGMALDLDGNYYLCHRFTSTQDVYGNLDTGIDFPKLKKYRKSLEKRNLACLNCECRSCCSGGCPYISFMKTGRYHDIMNNHCYYMKITYPIAKWMEKKR